jgi:hypothetical protein
MEKNLFLKQILELIEESLDQFFIKNKNEDLDVDIKIDF